MILRVERYKLTHVGCEDIGIASMQNLSLEIRSERPNTHFVILQCDIPVCGESARLVVGKALGLLRSFIEGGKGSPAR